MKCQCKSGSRSKHVRYRSPRRKPVDPEREIDKNAERARVEAVLERMEPKMLELMPEALEKRLDHCLYVLDPHSVLMRALPGEDDVLADFREHVKHDTSVAIFPVAVLERLFGMVADVFPHFHGLIAQLREIPPPGYARQVIAIGHSFAVRKVTCTTSLGGDDGPLDTFNNLIARCDFTKEEEVMARLPDGREEKMVSLPGMLKMLHHADPRLAKERGLLGAEFLQRFQRYSIPAVAAAAAMGNNDVGAVLAQTFDVARLHRGFDEAMAGDSKAFERAFDEVLDRLDATVS